MIFSKETTSFEKNTCYNYEEYNICVPIYWKKSLNFKWEEIMIFRKNISVFK